MKKILILEDDANRIRQFKQAFKNQDPLYCTTVDNAIQALGKNPDIKFFLLDHDLGGEQMVDSFGKEPTGFTFAKYLTTLYQDFSKVAIVVHSWNPSGANNIKNLIPSATIAPFGTSIFSNIINNIDSMPV